VDPLVATLVLVSAALHPLWNLLVKRNPRPEGAFFVLTVQLALFALVHALVSGADILAAREVWPLILVSVTGQILYGTSLLTTLKRGDISAYYPIVRASPLFIVVVGFLVFGEHYPASLLVAIALVLIGGFLLLYRPSARLLDDPRTLGFAVLAMCGTGVYSLADARLVQTIEPPVAFFWTEVLCAPIYAMLFRRIAIGPNLRRGIGTLLARPFHALLLASIVYASYILILIAYERGGGGSTSVTV
jgi:drug/metabolite transporter (DMT)-like permease